MYQRPRWSFRCLNVAGLGTAKVVALLPKKREYFRKLGNLKNISV